jgi:hypothetical protein
MSGTPGVHSQPSRHTHALSGGALTRRLGALEPVLDTLVSLRLSLAEVRTLILLEAGDATTDFLADRLGQPTRAVGVTTSSLERRGLIRRRWRDGPMRGCFTITAAGEVPLEQLANALSGAPLCGS